MGRNARSMTGSRSAALRPSGSLRLANTRSTPKRRPPLIQRLAGGYTEACTSPLTQKVPSTVESFRAFKGPHGESPALSWGITLDGATAVSFPVNRRHLTITVPVKRNVWVYQGKWSAAVRGFTVHFKDGHTETMP